MDRTRGTEEAATNSFSSFMGWLHTLRRNVSQARDSELELGMLDIACEAQAFRSIFRERSSNSDAGPHFAGRLEIRAPRSFVPFQYTFTRVVLPFLFRTNVNRISSDVVIGFTLKLVSLTGKNSAVS